MLHTYKLKRTLKDISCQPHHQNLQNATSSKLPREATGEESTGVLHPVLNREIRENIQGKADVFITQRDFQEEDPTKTEASQLKHFQEMVSLSTLQVDKVTPLCLPLYLLCEHTTEAEYSE